MISLNFHIGWREWRVLEGLLPGDIVTMFYNEYGHILSSVIRFSKNGMIF